MKAIIAALFTAALLTGCSKRTHVDGQIFVFRADRETVRLSGVTVIAGPQQVISNGVSQFIADVNRARRASEERVREASARIDAATQRQDAAEKAAQRNQRVIREGEMIFEENRDRMQNMREAERLELAATNRSIKQELDTANAHQKELDAALDAAKSELNAAIAEAESAVKGARDSSLSKELLEEFSAAPLDDPRFQKTMTDADGRFRITLEPNSMIVARANRKIPLGGTEFYLWAEPVMGTNLVLCNENMAVSWTQKEPEHAKN